MKAIIILKDGLNCLLLYIYFFHYNNDSFFIWKIPNHFNSFFSFVKKNLAAKQQNKSHVKTIMLSQFYPVWVIFSNFFHKFLLFFINCSKNKKDQLNFMACIRSERMTTQINVLYGKNLENRTEYDSFKKKKNKYD